MSSEVYEWFSRERGIRKETLDAFGATVKSNGDITFPYSNGTKLRPDPTKPLGDRRRFYFDKGKTPEILKAPGRWANVAFLVEGETDAMRLWQAFKDDNKSGVMPGVFAIGGVNTWLPTDAAHFENARVVFAILDNDDDYEVAAQVNAAWRKMRLDLGPKIRRLRLPGEVKDVCEFFETYDLEMLRALSQQGNVSRFRSLDLTREPPPPNWLLDGFIAKNDLTLCSGPSGLGKSWFTMGLSVAVADGWPDFLDKPLLAHGRVLYFDEENPEDVVFHRLRKLGLQNYSKVRYVWNNGVRVDLAAQEILDEALEFDPTLIVLDSLTRIHSAAENDSGEMSVLFNDSIIPLARETGAAVVLIHHHDKAGTGPRGSGDIKASVDGALDLYPTSRSGQFRLHLSKSRRRLDGEEITVEIVDMPDGNVQLHAAGHANLDETPF